MESKSTIGMTRKIKWIFFIFGIISGVVLTHLFYLFNHERGGYLIAKAEATDKSTIEILSPLYFNLDAFTLNLNSADHSNGRVLYIGLILKIHDKRTEECIKAILPEIRNHLLMLFSQKNASELSTAEGKAQLAIEAKKTINHLLAGEKAPEVSDVLFNAFILR